MGLKQKIEAIVRGAYGGEGAVYSEQAREHDTAAGVA